jgi:hypothetical protein
MGNCSGFCMSSNQATNVGEENTQQLSKKVITADKVRQAYMEKEDMMQHEGGAAGAAQYEEAYGRAAAANLANSNQMYPRKLQGAGSGSQKQTE